MPSAAGATLVGFSAVAMWATLALLTAASGDVPPFQLAALCFAIAAGLGAIVPAARPRLDLWRAQPAAIWFVGIAGLFGFHALYFTALRHAPPVEASLIAYLWPLLIVVFSAVLPGERLRPHHVVGALAGFAGAAVIVTGARGLAVEARFGLGYIAAFAAALVWAGYSLASRRFAAAPTSLVSGYCLATAALSLIAHLALEATVWPAGATQWLAVLGLGLGPVGAAFYVWDHGIKHGDIQLLGTAAYAAPVLSTLVLIAAGYGALTPGVAIACLLVAGGAAIASGGRLRRRRA